MSLPVESLSIRNIETVATPLSLDRSYPRYQESGGILTEIHYAELVEMRDPLPEDEIPSAKRSQAIFMANFAGIELTPREIFLYDYLRNSISNGEDTRSDICRLGDQRVLHQVLLVEGQEYKIVRLEATHPHIFRKT